MIRGRVTALGPILESVQEAEGAAQGDVVVKEALTDLAKLAFQMFMVVFWSIVLERTIFPRPTEIRLLYVKDPLQHTKEAK